MLKSRLQATSVGTRPWPISFGPGARGEGQVVNVTAYVQLSFELGEAFQFDWRQEGLVVGGIYYRMQVAHLKLCASCAFWLAAYPSQGHEMPYDAHTRSRAAPSAERCGTLRHL